MSKLPPSKRKLERARRDGRVLKSQLLGSICSLIILAILLKLLGHQAWVKSKMLLEYVLLGSLESPGAALVLAAKLCLIITGGWLILGATFSVLVEVAQVGFTAKPGAVTANFQRMTVASGLRRIATGIREGWFLLLKLGVVMVFVGFFLWRESRGVMGPSWCYAELQCTRMGTVISRFLLHGSICLLALAGVDYWITRLRYLRDLSMTPEEARREHKEDDGDPLLRSYRRSQHVALSLQTVIAQIKRSKVIIVERADAR